MLRLVNIKLYILWRVCCKFFNFWCLFAYVHKCVG